MSRQLSAKSGTSPPGPPLLKERGRNTGKTGAHKGRPCKFNRPFDLNPHRIPLTVQGQPLWLPWFSLWHTPLRRMAGRPQGTPLRSPEWSGGD